MTEENPYKKVWQSLKDKGFYENFDTFEEWDNRDNPDYIKPEKPKKEFIDWFNGLPPKEQEDFNYVFGKN